MKKVSTENCWLYAGNIDSRGYGLFILDRKRTLVHRIMHENFIGPIADGLEVDHLCRVRACINPDHLEAVTHQENILRGIGPPALNAQKTHCYKGHPFDEENTYRHHLKDGRIQRKCRTCGRERVRYHYAKRKQLA